MMALDSVGVRCRPSVLALPRMTMDASIPLVPLPLAAVSGLWSMFVEVSTGVLHRDGFLRRGSRPSRLVMHRKGSGNSTFINICGSCRAAWKLIPSMNAIRSRAVSPPCGTSGNWSLSAWPIIRASNIPIMRCEGIAVSINRNVSATS